tara:strand:- start:3129 stop:3539 length:411 start_codon:yes stop_codon:yes gene_type:complete
MKFNIIPLKYEDYDNILVGWWKDWGWEAPMREFLPQDGEGGIIVYDGDTPVCAGFLYNTNSKVAWVDWIISNKQYRVKPNRKEAIELLIDSLTNMAKGMGKGFTYALIKHDGLIKTYESLGYTQGDSYNKEMIKVL